MSTKKNLSYEEIINQKKSILERIQDFFFSRLYILIVFSALCFLTIKLFSRQYIPFEFWSWIVVAVYLLLVLIQRNKYLQDNPEGRYEKSYMKQHKIELAIVCAMIVFFFFLFVNNPDWLWLLCVLVVSIAIILVIKKYPENYNPIRQELSALKKVEILTLLIAICQLFVAYPQMKNSYKSATSKDVKNLKESIQELDGSFESLVISSIPDSLITPEVKKAVEFRNNLYYRIKFLSDLGLKNVSEDYEITPFNTDSDSGFISDTKGISKKLINTYSRLLSLYTKYDLLNQKMIYMVSSMFSLNKYEESIIEYYNHEVKHDDIFKSFVDILQLKSFNSSLTDYLNLLECNSKERDDMFKSMDIHISNRSNNLHDIKVNKIIKDLDNNIMEDYNGQTNLLYTSLDIATKILDALNSVIYSEVYNIDYFQGMADSISVGAIDAIK